MFTLILVVLFGLAFSFFATNNTNWVSIALGPSYQIGAPMYMVILGALLVGLILALIFNLVDNLASSMAIHGKENAIKGLSHNVETLEERVHELEVENAHLKGEKEEAHEHIVEEKREDYESRPSWLDKLRYRLSV